MISQSRRRGPGGGVKVDAPPVKAETLDCALRAVCNARWGASPGYRCGFLARQVMGNCKKYSPKEEGK